MHKAAPSLRHPARVRAGIAKIHQLISGQEGYSDVGTTHLGAGHPSEPAELVIMKNIDSFVVCLQLVHLLPKHIAPEFLADELDYVQLLGEPALVASVPLRQPLSYVEANVCVEQVKFNS